MVNPPKIAGFVMTYHRPVILKGTLEAIWNQTLPLEKIWIIDNSSDELTKLMIESINDVRVVYYNVGYNVGPAGAAKIGLKLVSDAGYDWIYWGDDDDPPKWSDTLEKMFEVVNNANLNNIGIIGAVGQNFNKCTGRIVRIANHHISESAIVHVDSIAGNQSMIVNASVVKSGVLPTEKLFFGFEELDFCLQVKNNGFELIVSSALFLRAREKYGRVSYNRSLYTKKDIHALKRQYYSTRNLLWILWHHGYYKGLVVQIGSTVGKMMYGFRFGFQYGFPNFKYLLFGALHFIFGIKGKVF